MARSAWLTLVSMGLSAGTLVVSFLGCGSLYDDVGGGKGSCEDDKNPCTIDKCASGATVHEPKPDGETCSLGANAGKCSAGACMLDCLASGECNCAEDSECPTDEACATWACTMGTCQRTPKADNEIVGPLGEGDCKKEICTAGTKNTVQDDMDTPEDTAGDCQKWTCENSAPKAIPDDMDIPADTTGDCKKPVCSNGMPSTTNDNADEPPDTGCVDNSCLNGMPVATNAVVGTQCMGGVCDSKGACVDCLSAQDYPACVSCKVKKCDGEACTTNGECKIACADLVCCNTACTDECKSCNVGNNKGTCTNIPYLEADTSYTDPVSMTPNVTCTSPFLCNGSGKCLGGFGAPCTADGGCLGGKCAMPSKLCLGAKDEPCSNGGQCASGTCTGNKCT